MFHRLFNGNWCRLTELVCENPASSVVFEYPTKAMRDEYTAKGEIPYITGFENDKENGVGCSFDFILSNGQRSNQRDSGSNYFSHMIPADEFHRIRIVNICYDDNFIRTLFFYDKDWDFIFRIGLDYPWRYKEK